MVKKSGKRMYWGATILVAFVFVGSGLMKIVGGDATQEMARALGGENNLLIIGLLELFIALIWLLPRTGVAGSFLAMAYMGGAMAVHFVSGQPVIVPVVIEVLIWLAAAIRFPELTKRLFNRELSQIA